MTSGRFVLRIDPELHAALRNAADAGGLSLNEYCARKLAAPSATLEPPVANIVRRAASQFGGDLAGVIAFGSWARGNPSAASDVDVLVVVDAAVTITRSLYDVWDAEPLRWDSRMVEVHIVRIPEAGSRVSGMWAEAAIDGVVLFDRDLLLSRWLVEVRHRILAGEIVRRRVHGQPYWVGAA